MGRRSDERIIAGELYVSPRKAAEIIGCCRSTLDTILAKSKSGSLKPALSWYRDTPKSPIWIKKSELESWAEKRGGMRT